MQGDCFMTWQSCLIANKRILTILNFTVFILKIVLMHCDCFMTWQSCLIANKRFFFNLSGPKQPKAMKAKIQLPTFSRPGRNPVYKVSTYQILDIKWLHI